MTNLESIEGIGEVNAQKLKIQNINSIEELLDKGKTPKGRQEIESATGIAHGHVLNWINRADLARVNGISTQYADLLECSGVNTVPELAQRNSENLHSKMIEVNDVKHLVRQTPSLGQVQDWIAQAKQLPPVITY